MSGKFKKGQGNLRKSISYKRLQWSLANKKRKKISARVFGARIIFVDTLHSKFAVFHKNLLYENIYRHAHNDNSDIYSYKLVHFLIFVCLIGQRKSKISQGKVGEKSGNFDILYEWQPRINIHAIAYYHYNSIIEFAFRGVWKVGEGFPGRVLPKTLRWVVVYSSVTFHING